MTRYRVREVREALVEADSEDEAIQVAFEHGGMIRGTSNVDVEAMRPRSPSTFEQQAAAVKRSPSGTMAAVRIPDTDPAPAPESER